MSESCEQCTMGMTNIEKLKVLSVFTRTISHQAYGLITHLPEIDAIENACYQNIEEKVARDGGSIQYGWVFIYKLTIPKFESEGYFTAIHHAVWRNPVGKLIDVTPLHSEANLRPIYENDKIRFLADDKALPLDIEGFPGPLPMKFFPLNNGKKLAAYMLELQEREEESCRVYNEQMAQKVRELKAR